MVSKQTQRIVTPFLRDQEMKRQIVAKLLELEKSEQVKILYACESGSRAWGFPSANSDFDVRFLYVHPRDWYLSVNLERKRDVIERDVEHVFDLSGWDLRKALALYHKSNPPLAEWLCSPIVYLEKTGIAQGMRDLLPDYYNPLSAAYHYWHMAEGNYREYLKGEVVWIKKYFYVLRPLLAILWLEADLGPVPTEFSILVDRIVERSELRDAIGTLIEQKRQGVELDRGPRIALISDFLDDQMKRLSEGRFNIAPTKGPVEPLDELFGRALDQAWE
jgi:predicted nucleotidyltransferase